MRVISHILALPIFLLCLSQPGWAQSTYQVSVDTSAMSGRVGNIDFQFNPGAGAQSATVAIDDFFSYGILTGSSTNSGDASGQLPASLMINNTTTYNDVFQGITFGNYLIFTASLSGPALSPPPGVTGGSSFAFSLYDQTGTVPLLTTDPGGSVAQINLNPDGSISTQTFKSTPYGDPPVAIITPVVSPVPESNTGTVLAYGLLVLGFTTASRGIYKRKNEKNG